MGEQGLPKGLTEAEVALFALVTALERDDYRSASGVRATTTTAFVEAKTLVSLFVLLDRRTGSRP